MKHLRTFRWALILYALFDLFIGGYPGGFLPMTPVAAAQNATANSTPGSNLSFVAGRFVANRYNSYGGEGTAQIYTGNSTTGSATITVRGGYINLNDGRSIVPYAVGVPIVINDSNPELVTPTTVSGCYKAQGLNQDGILVTCSITASFTFTHGIGAVITSGTGGIAEAVNDAWNNGGGVVVLAPGLAVNTSCTGCYTSVNNAIANILPYGNVSIEDDRGANVASRTMPYWSVQPSGTTVLGTPTTRVGSASNCTGSNTVCDTTIAVASGGFTNAAQYVAVTCVDILGGESPASATAHYTSAGAVQIEFLAPAAQTGCVGWRPYIGLSYATAYLITPTSSICTLTTLETVLPACAITNATYGQTGSNAFVSKPATNTQIVPQSGGVAAAYNPNTLSRQTSAYQPSRAPGLGFPLVYAPFPITGALTAGQLGVVGTIPLPTGILNWIGTDLHLSFDVTATPSTGGTAQGIDVEIGDITDFTTGQPKVVCIGNGDITASGTAAITFHEECDLNVTATGTTGTIVPGGFGIEQVVAQGTIGNPFAIPPTSVTADVQDQDTLFFVYLQTSGAESTTPPQMQNLRLSFF